METCARLQEGTLVFAEEPLLQVTAPVLEAQIAETYLLSVIHYETLVASKAARVVRAAGGPRAFWSSGRGGRMGRKPECERRGRRVWAVARPPPTCWPARFMICLWRARRRIPGRRFFPASGAVLKPCWKPFPTPPSCWWILTIRWRARKLRRRWEQRVPGVRLDSGDLLEKSRHVREILDRHGRHDAKIVTSGDLNEFKIEALVAGGAPIDSFGVGTDLVTSRDVPALSVVYKLVETEAGGVVAAQNQIQRGEGLLARPQAGLPLFRSGQYHHDLLACAQEDYPEAAPLLEPVMRAGRRLAPAPR